MITQISFAAIFSNGLSSSCNILRSENLCHMLQQSNWMILRNLLTQTWNQVTAGGMTSYISWRCSYLWWFQLLQYLGWPNGSLIVLLFNSSDKTDLSNYSGDQMEWPVYLSLGNNNLTITLQSSNLDSMLVALLGIPPKYNIKGDSKSTSMKEQQIHNQEVVRKVFELFFRPFDLHFNTPQNMLGVDVLMRQWYCIICVWIAEYFKNIHLLSIK